MKPPPLLLGAALLFWGWQSELFLAGALLAVILESARVTHARWDFSEDDFRRIWTFCMLLFLGGAIYAFTTNEGPSNFGNFLDDPNLATQRDVGLSSARTAASLFRWLPLIFFPFVVAHAFSLREVVPLTAISMLARWRTRREKRTGRPQPAARQINPAYPYFGICLVAASVHGAEDLNYFWGAAALLAWTLWAHRPRRFGFLIWASCLAAALVMGFYGQRSVGHVQRYLENLNPQWISHFMRRSVDPTRIQTDIGRIGRLKGSARIVIRLESETGKVPPLLREASYQVFKSPTWYAQTGRRDFENVPEDYPNSRSWTLLPNARKTESVRIASYLEGGNGLLPLPHGVSRLEELPAYVLKKNSKGAVLAEGPKLVIFDALYGPHETTDSPSDDYDDVYAPQIERPALDQVIEEAQLRNLALSETLARLQTFFSDHFAYSLWEPEYRVRRNQDTPLSRFLLNTRSGHCEYFATGTVLLLRRLGIPARYAVGFAVHEHDGNQYVVRLRDAHAWCLVWDEKKQTWVDFDTTPGTWLAEEQKRQSGLQWLHDFWERIKFEIAKVRWGQTQLRQYLLWIMIPALILSLYQLVFRGRWRRQRQAGATGETPPDWPGLDSDFYRLERKLSARGVPRQASEPLSDWLERVAAQPDLAELREPLAELLRLHYRHRFDPLGLNGEDRAVLRRETHACLEKIAGLEQSAARVSTAQGELVK